jgi:hypothetical protein
MGFTVRTPSCIWWRKRETPQGMPLYVTSSFALHDHEILTHAKKAMIYSILIASIFIMLADLVLLFCYRDYSDSLDTK